MRVALIGWWGRGNMGDELLHRLIRDWLAPHQVDAIAPRQVVEDAPGQFVSFEDFDACVDEYDLVIFGGGGLLNDRYVRSVLPKQRLARISAPLYGLSLGIPSPDWLDGLEGFVERCDHLSVRDPLARHMLLKRYPRANVEVLPDPGFLLPGHPAGERSEVVGLNVRDVPASWLMGLPEDLTESLRTALLNAVEEMTGEGVPVRVLGTEPRDHDLFLEWGLDSTMLTAENAAEVVGSLQALVTMRLHGGIVSLTQGTPVRVLNYQSKIAGLGSMVAPELVHAVPGVSITALAREALAEQRGRHADRVQELRGALGDFRASRIG